MFTFEQKNPLMMISHTEENYLKAIFKLLEKEKKSASTNAISKEINTSAASVTDMLKRLSEKKLIHYEKYKGVTLTTSGEKIATTLIRKHRLWEVFLVEKLDFSWDEIHDIAEEMEHIQSNELINRLDTFLEYPKFDPHGDPIPDEEGNFTFRRQSVLAQIKPDENVVVVGVREHSTQFLQYLDQIGLVLGTRLKVVEQIEYDGSIKININLTNDHIISNKVSKNIYVQKI